MPTIETLVISKRLGLKEHPTIKGMWIKEKTPEEIEKDKKKNEVFVWFNEVEKFKEKGIL